MHLYVARACGPMFSSLRCTERVDPNTWTWWDLFFEMNVSTLLIEFLVFCIQSQGCSQHSESFEGHGNFCPDHVWCAEIRFCVWTGRSLFHSKYHLWLLLGKMIPPCGNGSCWWRWPFGTYNVEVRLDCIFCASESSALLFFYFSVGSQRRAENMIARTSWKESKLLKTSQGDDFFLCLQIWPLPVFHLDPRAAKCHLSTRGHVGHFLLLSTKRGKQKGFQSKRPSKMGPCTGCLGLCHCIWDGQARWQQ